MKRSFTAFLIVVATLLVPERVHAGAVRIALLAETTVVGDAIVLARLLPVDSSQELREKAEKVWLGSAPALGSERRLARQQIARAIRATNWAGVEFAIPEVVLVQRPGKAIAKEDICEILRRELAARGRWEANEIRPEDVELQSTWQMPDELPRLRLKELVVDPLLGRMRFRLRSVRNPNAPDIYGWLRVGGDNATLKVAVAKEPPAKPAEVSMVKANRPATLFLHSLNSESLLHVRALQSGSLGESIRVRFAANGHTLVAKVVGPDRLEASF